MDFETAGLDLLVAQLKNNPPKFAVDPEGKICDMVERLQDKVRKEYACAWDQSGSDSFIKALEKLFNSIEIFKDWIETHDAILEPSTGIGYSNVDDLFAALNKITLE
jgi:hypothetical protein